MAAKQALGRGLKALIPDTPRARSGMLEISVDHLRPNPQQPRHRFEPTALAELADSIRRHGVLQPILVSEDGPDRYLILTGERRWRAAREAGLKTVPAVIREQLADEQQLELALVENLQRRDLTPLEEARAFESLRSSLGLSQAEIASRVGMERSTIANSLRLLKLDDEIQELIENGELSAGHGRALLAFADPSVRSHWARKAVDEGLSVRSLERAAHADRKDRSTRGRPRREATPDPNLLAAQDRLSLRLGAPVTIRRRANGGEIVISCSDEEQLMRLYEVLMEGT